MKILFVVTAEGVLLALPTGALSQAEEIEIAAIAVTDAPGPLPGTPIAGPWQLTIASAVEDLSGAATLRAPYADTDQDGRVDGLDPVITESMLTLWRYDAVQDAWLPLSGAMVIPEANVLVVQTDQVGLFGVFQVTGQVGVLGDETDDVQLAAASAQQTDDGLNSSWTDIGVAVTSPLVAAWNTTAVADGEYEVRAVCAADAAVVAALQTSAEAASGSNSGCFIATATYGSPVHARVQALRDFRDAYLLTHAAGRWAVEQYYRLSPPLAQAIRHRPWLRAVVRVGITPVVWAVSLTPQQAGRLLMAFSLLILFVGLRFRQIKLFLRRHDQTVENRL